MSSENSEGLGWQSDEVQGALCYFRLGCYFALVGLATGLFFRENMDWDGATITFFVTVVVFVIWVGKLIHTWIRYKVKPFSLAALVGVLWPPEAYVASVWLVLSW
jgi:hypothetical protein